MVHDARGASLNRLDKHDVRSVSSVLDAGRFETKQWIIVRLKNIKKTLLYSKNLKHINN